MALATQPRGGYFRAAQVGRPRVSCGSGGAALPSDCATQLTDWRWNKCACIDAFFLVCVRVRGVRVRGWKEPTALFPTV